MNLGPGHIYGQCIISDEYKICFILIPKNMSSTMRNYLKKKLNGYEYNYFNCSDKQKKYFTFCICREVVKRFHSAINTILHRKKTDITNIQNKNLRFYVENKKDEHLVKQIEFIKNIRIDLIINIESISKYFEISNKSIKNIENKFNINDEIIRNVYKDDIEFYECNKAISEIDLNNFLTIMKIKNYELNKKLII